MWPFSAAVLFICSCDIFTGAGPETGGSPHFGGSGMVGIMVYLVWNPATPVGPTSQTPSAIVGDCNSAPTITKLIYSCESCELKHIIYIYTIIYKYIDLYRHLASAVFCRVAFENKHPPGAPTWVAWLVTLGQKLAWAVPLPSQELADLAATISRTTKVILKSFFGYSYMVTPPV